MHQKGHNGINTPQENFLQLGGVKWMVFTTLALKTQTIGLKKLGKKIVKNGNGRDG